MWLTELIPIPFTGLCIGGLLTFGGVCPAEKAFAPYGHFIVFVIPGSFFITTSMKRHGLDQRIAKCIASMGGNAPRRALVFGSCLLALVLNGPAVSALFNPVVLRLSGALPGVRLSDS